MAVELASPSAETARTYWVLCEGTLDKARHHYHSYIPNPGSRCPECSEIFEREKDKSIEELIAEINKLSKT